MFIVLQSGCAPEAVERVRHVAEGLGYRTRTIALGDSPAVAIRGYDNRPNSAIFEALPAVRGADGVMVEVHVAPEQAWSDGAQSLTVDGFARLAAELRALGGALAEPGGAGVTRVDWGDLRLTVVPAGRVWMDGGGMFGIVPRVLWSRERQPDEQNRIELAMNLLLIEDGKSRTLVDTGAGIKNDEKFRKIHRLETRSAAELLAPTGLTPDAIDRVICTHLHFDHVGGNTEPGSDGALRAAFPNATYVVQRDELDAARRRDNERIRAGFPPENFEPLAAEDRLEIVEGAVSLTDAIQLVPAPGHTPGMQIVVVRTGDGTLAHMADLLPTASHVPYAWIMAYDLEPLRTLESKKRILPQAAAEGWRLLLEHDARTPFVTLEEESGRLQPRPLEVEA